MSFWPDAGAIRGPQDLEDLATASWFAETLFAALDLGVFRALGDDELALEELAERCGAEPTAFARLARALSALGLLSLRDGRVACTAVSRRHLLPGKPEYLGHSLAYRRLLGANWGRLAEAVRSGGSPVTPPLEEDEAAYRDRVRAYVLAMDDVARHKARLIAERLDLGGLRPQTVLDLGGGAGAIAAEIVRRNPGWSALVVDVPEVADEARRVRAERADGDLDALGIEFAGLNLLASLLPRAPGGADGWGVVVASNIVHAYGPPESASLLDRAAAALAGEGLLVVHDFWTDGPGRGPSKAALFDLHMLLHTYQGRTYEWQWVRRRLEERGLHTIGPVPLGGHSAREDTSLVVAARTGAGLRAVRFDPLERLDGIARELGFRKTAPLAPAAVVTAPWVGEKCRFGCANYSRGGQCPPRSPALADTRATLASYGRALLVQGEPPTAEFHRRMLALERAAFLGGCHQALAFVAGPCRLCPECEPDACRQPKRARPSMEASGIDVFATARAVGWDLMPVPDRDSPATYVGLLLVE